MGKSDERCGECQALPKPELGTKRDCPSCGAKFYDLNKNPIVCPKCSHEFVPELVSAKAKRVKPVPEKPKEKVAAVTRAAVDEEDNVSLDAMRDEELEAEDVDGDLLDVDEDADDEADNDAFLEDDEDDDDVSGLVRNVDDEDT